MVDEKEEHYEEEGEYHFSDDQVNYDVEPEAPKTLPASPFTKEALLAKFNQHRRGILGAVSLLVLIGVVYKILIPASTSPSTEFNQAAVAIKAAKPTVTKTKNTTVSQSVAAPASSNVAQPPVVENKPATPVALQQNQMPATAVAVTPPTPASLQVNTMQQPADVSRVSPVTVTQTSAGPSSVISPPMQQATSQINTVQAPVIDAQAKDRIIALEQQSAAMMNLLQTEYAQKIADTETQTNAMHGKMEELNKRINHMEASLSQITQLLQGVSKSQASGVMGSAPVSNSTTRPTEPRMIYSVQAIIPGRAWLKSEAGDTVTVAEGDYLKGYGRVTKIDPYDGIVAIDTGSKIINLSYGVGGD